MPVTVAMTTPTGLRDPLRDAMRGYTAEKCLCIGCIVYIVYLTFASARIIAEEGCKVVQGCWVSWDRRPMDHVAFPTHRTEDRSIVLCGAVCPTCGGSRESRSRRPDAWGHVRWS